MYLLKIWCRPTWSNTYEFGLEILRQTRFSSSLHIAYVDPNTRTSTCYGSAHFSGDIRSRLIDHSGERYTRDDGSENFLRKDRWSQHDYLEFGYQILQGKREENATSRSQTSSTVSVINQKTDKNLLWPYVYL